MDGLMDGWMDGFHLIFIQVPRTSLIYLKHSVVCGTTQWLQSRLWLFLKYEPTCLLTHQVNSSFSVSLWQQSVTGKR